MGVLSTLAGQLPSPTSARNFTDFCAGNVGPNQTLIEACNLDKNFLAAAIGPFMFASGGYLPLIFWGVICMSIYLKYRNYLYPSIVACVTMIATGLWLPGEVQTYLYLGLGTGFAVIVFTLIWRIPRDTA